jgi:hypothetical protein
MSRQTLATEKFFSDCHKQFGDRFDYSETIYTTLKKPVKVTCRKHHKTFVVPEARNHLRPKSGGCSECEQEAARLPLKDFIERANDIHGAKYDYSRVTYDNLNQKVTIKCPLHGWFDQKAAHHLSGHECEECGITKRGISRRVATEGIIERFKKRHGNKYDYSKIDYQGFHKPVTIICPIPGHGEFRQSPNVHLMGCGCQTCGGNPRLTQSEFLRKAHEVHGNRYDYSRVEVDGVDQPVEIICRKHESFWQTPYSHLNGANCNRCSDIVPKTREEAIESFRATHGKKYDDSLVDYKNNATKVIVICPEPGHGQFLVTPVNHRRGRGCPDCSTSGFDVTKPAILYYVRIDDVTRGTLYKIGITNRSFDDRYGSEDQAKMTRLKIWEFEDGHKAKQREAEIISEYINFQYKGPAVISTGNVDQHREVFTCDILSLDHDVIGV